MCGCGEQNSLKIEKDLGSEDLIDGVPIPIYLDKVRGVEISNHRIEEIKNISSIIQRPRPNWSPRQGKSKKAKVYTSLERRIYDMEISKNHEKLSAIELALRMLYDAKVETTQADIIKMANSLGAPSSKIKYGLLLLRKNEVFPMFINTHRVKRTVFFTPNEDFRSKSIDDLATVFSIYNQKRKVNERRSRKQEKSTYDVELLMRDALPMITKIGDAFKKAGLKFELKISN